MHQHILIEAVTPSVDGGRYAAKAIVGEPCVVEADIFRDGHEHIRAVLRWQKKGDDRPEEVPFRYFDNDRFRGEIPVDHVGTYLFTIEAWTDVFETWLDGFSKKVAAERSTALDLREGTALLRDTIARATGATRGLLEEAAATIEGGATPDEALAIFSGVSLRDVVASLDGRDDRVTLEPALRLFACPKLARFGSWYEFFPRSEPGGTLQGAERRLQKLAQMGFDVVYLAPVHPIGITNRKGKNDEAAAEPGEPGSPWAIGSSAGGHTAIDPDLGTLADFDHFVASAQNLGIEVALDFAIQCSPDHPWVTEHPDWFEHRADGSFRFAENPPFEYRDVYKLDFDTEDRVGLYSELYRVLAFWIEHGVTIFRVDNPHTKPVTFWEWLIAKVHATNPEVIFLGEAFTKPKMMKALSKAGFTQSYTYFTWRNEKKELEAYMLELTQTAMRHYLLPNFFTNTHDVLPEFLQKGGPAAFKIRLVLAATLAPSYGIYSGFELGESEALPGREEYLNSEKFEIKARDYDSPGNLNGLLEQLNRIRRENPALQELANVEFLETGEDNITVFLKTSRDRSNQLIVAVTLDPLGPRDGNVEVPMDELGLHHGASYEVTDLLTGARYTWGAKNYVRLDPSDLPAHIFLVGKTPET